MGPEVSVRITEFRLNEMCPTARAAGGRRGHQKS